MSALGIIVVHNHRIDAQFDHIGPGDLQTPNEKGLQKTPEQKHSRPGKGLEKAFDLMRRSHVRSIGFDAAGVSFILRELVEIGQSPAGAIDKEAQHLLEKFRYANAFAVFTDGGEPAIEPAENLDAVQIGHEQGQARSAGQPVGGGFNASNFKFILLVISAMFAHRVLYPLGVVMLAITLVGIIKHYNTLPEFGGLFFFKNRSH